MAGGASGRSAIHLNVARRPVVCCVAHGQVLPKPRRHLRHEQTIVPSRKQQMNQHGKQKRILRESRGVDRKLPAANCRCPGFCRTGPEQFCCQFAPEFNAKFSPARGFQCVCFHHRILRSQQLRQEQTIIIFNGLGRFFRAQASTRYETSPRRTKRWAHKF